MGRTKYCCNQKDYEDYYVKQAGSGIPGFHGTRYQCGAGLGSVLTGLLKYVAPIIKKGALALGKYALTQAVDRGSKMIANVVQPKGIKRHASKKSASRISKRKRGTSSIFD